MDQYFDQNHLNLKDANIQSPPRNTKKEQKKCSQCDYTSETGHLRRHLKTHSGEKTNKCK